MNTEEMETIPQSRVNVTLNLQNVMRTLIHIHSKQSSLYLNITNNLEQTGQNPCTDIEDGNLGDYFV